MAESKQQQQLKEITEKLEQGVKELFTSEKYTEYLRVMSQFHNYSFSNTLLIAMQKPEATLVAGYGAWQNKFERNVKKGEKAIKIFAPAPRKVEVERDMLDPETQRPVIDENGEVKKEKVTVQQPYFKITSVFDVSQTDGKPLPELDTVQDLTGSVEGYNIFFEALQRTSKVPMDFQPIEGGSHGFYHQNDKRIAIAEGMSEAQNVKTGIHEIAHSRMHDRDMTDAENGIMVDRRTREVQAESVAYTVCQHYGIDTSDYSFGYIAGWSEGKEMKELRSSMEVIRREADSMIKEIDRNLEEIRKERQQTNEVAVDGEKSIIAGYYVVPDMTDPEIQTFDDLDAALQAYFASPNEKMKSFGIEKAVESTERIEFIHCVNGIDYAVVNFGDDVDAKNPEVIAVADRVFAAMETYQPEIAYSVGDMYFSIQRTDEGYDYSIYDTDYSLLDGGVVENNGQSLSELVSELLDEADLSFGDCRVINYNEFMDEVQKASEAQNIKEASENTESKSKINSMYQNYLDIKAENADRIVLYQVGDFFEAFNADAKTLAKDLDLMLTSRPISEMERVPLVGLPKHNLENYVEKLRAQGHKITIAALDEGERRVYQMVSPQSEEPTIPLTSENIEPSKALNGYSRKDVEETVLLSAQAELEEMKLSESVKLLGARVYGSRTRDGLFTESSDIDVVLSFDAPNGVLYEDTFFNTINGNHLEIGGLPIDVNPISLQETGTLEDYMTRAEAYLDRKELHKAVYAHLTNSTNWEADVLQAARITFPEAKGDTLQEILQNAAIPKLREQAEVMDCVEVFGQEGVFTNGRVNKKDLPEGLFAYDLRGSDDDPGQPATIEPTVLVNHAGTVVLSEKLEFGEKDRLELGEDWAFTGETDMALENFYDKVAPGKGETVYAKDAADIAEKAVAFYGSKTKMFDHLGNIRETILNDLVEQLNHGFVAYMDEKNLNAKAAIERENAELDAIDDFLTACKLYDITFGFDDGIFSATDGETTWDKTEFYEFLLNDVVVLNENEKLVDGFSIRDDVLIPIIQYAKEAGATIHTQPVTKEEPAKPTIVPLSNLTFAEAKEKGEIDAWRANRKETEACAEQFDAEFGMAYHERRMPEFLSDMVDKYGMERVKIVLASTIQLANHDGRYYPSTKADAAKVHIPGTNTEDYSKDIRMSYHVNCHPVMVNSAFRELQKMEREHTSVKINEPAAVEHDGKAPKASVLSRLQEKQKQVSQNKTSPARTEGKKRGVEL